MRRTKILITANFEHNLESIRCYFHQQQQQPQLFDKLLDKLFDEIIPNLQSHPMMGFDFLAQKVNTIEELRHVEDIKTKLPKNTSIRQYNDQNYILLYSLHNAEITLLSIKHQQQLYFDLRAVD